MQLQFCPLFSGSSGNAIYVGTDKTKILIDAGLSGAKITAEMAKIGLTPADLTAILVTHEHADHINGVGVLSRRYHLPIYASTGTWAAMSAKLGAIDAPCRVSFEAGEDFSIRMGAGEWIVLACAVLYGLHIVYLGTVCRKDDPVQTAFWQLLAAGIGCALLIVSGGVGISSEAIRGMLVPCLFLGILSTGVCYLGQSWGQTRMPPAQASVIMSAEGMFGMIFSLLLGLESFRWRMLAGGLLVTLSVILVSLAPQEETEKS